MSCTSKEIKIVQSRRWEACSSCLFRYLLLNMPSSLSYLRQCYFCYFPPSHSSVTFLTFSVTSAIYSPHNITLWIFLYYTNSPHLIFIITTELCVWCIWQWKIEAFKQLNRSLMGAHVCLLFTPEWSGFRTMLVK